MAEWEHDLKGWLNSVLDDQMVKILLSESSLTRRQFEGLLIDILSEEIAQKRIIYTEKAKILPKSVTRGAYNRILTQARRNVVKAFFTLYLLGYLGLLDLTQLNDYIHFGNEIKDYIDAYKKNERKGGEEINEKVLKAIHKELLDKTNMLAKPSSLKPLSKL